MAGDQMTGSLYDVAGSWQNGIPTTGDNAIFPMTNSNDITDPGNAADGIDLALLATMPGFKGSLGTTGDPIEGATALLHVMGIGDVFWNCAAHTAGQDVNEARIEAGNPDAVIELGGQSGDAGEFDLIEFMSGRLTLKTGIAFKSGMVLSMASARASLIIESGAAALPRLEQYGGMSKPANIVTEHIMWGGTCIKESNKTGIIKLGGGARMVYNHPSVGAEVTLVIVGPGSIFDLMQNGEKKVIDKLIEWPGAKVLRDPKLHTIADYIRVNESGVAQAA